MLIDELEREEGDVYTEDTSPYRTGGNTNSPQRSNRTARVWAQKTAIAAKLTRFLR